MQLHELKTNKTSAKRVGRGGKRGKTSGRGTKGQKSRAGGTPRPELRDIIKKIPKLRGHGKNRGATVVGSRKSATVVTLSDLEGAFSSGEVVTRQSLVDKGLLSGNNPVKILGNGSLTNSLTIQGIPMSTTARASIEKAGGKIE
jgi:large subunit ribosomal protein L15